MARDGEDFGAALRRAFDPVGMWKRRRLELRDEVFARFGTARFGVYDLAKPRVFSCAPARRRLFLGQLAGEVERLVAEGVLIRLDPPAGGKYPLFRIRTPADVARDGAPVTLDTIARAGGGPDS